MHLEPQSYRQDDFHERMFIYFSRLFERHRRQHKLVIPIAIFTSDQARDEPDTYAMEIPGHEIVKFRFLKVELRGQDWRKFVDSDNPVAAALLAKMGYNERDKKQVRLAYLRMLLRLGRKLDDARLALVMSVADVYFNPDPEQDEAMLRDLGKQDPEGAKAIMEMKDLVPMWKRWGYEEGIEKGREEGRLQLIRKLLEKGFDPDEVAATLELPLDEVRKAERPV
ncbi:transposase [Cohnella zeiphila]|uniref:Transposase n=1 Tax=Cohnella zeiphila TaxID=2761120 RepID=A0A7X0VXI2_9BACL|nr:transposase [Cohnella zeiphila]MBB6734304.1 transposase [Cohnella zeiphila]